MGGLHFCFWLQLASLAEVPSHTECFRSPIDHESQPPTVTACFLTRPWPSYLCVSDPFLIDVYLVFAHSLILYILFMIWCIWPKEAFLKSELAMPYRWQILQYLSNFWRGMHEYNTSESSLPQMSFSPPHTWILVWSVWIIISFFHTLHILLHCLLLFTFQMRVLLLIRFSFLSNNLLFDACRVSHLILAIHKSHV